MRIQFSFQFNLKVFFFINYTFFSKFYIYIFFTYYMFLRLLGSYYDTFRRVFVNANISVEHRLN